MSQQQIYSVQWRTAQWNARRRYRFLISLWSRLIDNSIETDVKQQGFSHYHCHVKFKRSRLGVLTSANVLCYASGFYMLLFLCQLFMMRVHTHTHTHTHTTHTHTHHTHTHRGKTDSFATDWVRVVIAIFPTTKTVRYCPQLGEQRKTKRRPRHRGFHNIVVSMVTRTRHRCRSAAITSDQLWWIPDIKI